MIHRVMICNGLYRCYGSTSYTSYGSVLACYTSYILIQVMVCIVVVALQVIQVIHACSVVVVLQWYTSYGSVLAECNGLSHDCLRCDKIGETDTQQ